MHLIYARSDCETCVYVTQVGSHTIEYDVEDPQGPVTVSPPELSGLACTPASGSVARLLAMHRIFQVAVADVYPHYITKVERKGRSEAELR